MAVFIYLPHVIFVAENGLDHFEASMAAQHALTRRFSAEFSIRAFLERDPERTLARLRDWARDPDVHVRRLVSEGTRPRLPVGAAAASVPARPAPGAGAAGAAARRPRALRPAVGGQQPQRHREGPSGAADRGLRALVRAARAPSARASSSTPCASLVKGGDRRALRVLGFEGGEQGGR